MLGKMHQPMEKKIPQNPRYAEIRPKVNSHNPIAPIIPEKLLVKRSQEPFMRVTISGLLDYLNPRECIENESIYNLAQNKNDYSTPALSTLTLNSEIAAPSLISVATDTSAELNVKFLLLDVRSNELFQKGHITGAINYPIFNLSRDKITSQLHRFKAYPQGKTLIIYDTDEKSTTSAAMTFFSKGWNNVIMLTGGYEHFCEFILHKCSSTPHSLVLHSKDTNTHQSASRVLSNVNSDYKEYITGEIDGDLIRRFRQSRASGSRVQGSTVIKTLRELEEKNAGNARPGSTLTKSSFASAFMKGGEKVLGTRAVRRDGLMTDRKKV